jgi:purine-binding chemotaxis protein CheW
MPTASDRVAPHRPQVASYALNSGLAVECGTGRNPRGCFLDEHRRFLIVEVGDIRCGLPLESVAEIMRPLPVKRLEQAPQGVCGLSLIRGKGMPVIDLAELLQKASQPAGRFVSVRTGQGSCALAVSAVLGIESIAAAAWQELPPLFHNVEAAQALSVLDRDLVLLLETARLVPLIQSISAEPA